MKRIRTYKHHVLLYDLEKEGSGYILSIEKSCSDGVERSAYLLYASKCELTQLMLRLWRSGVTPMSLVYVLEDEGYLPIKYDDIGEAFTEDRDNLYIVKRDRNKNSLNSKAAHDSLNQTENKAKPESEADTVKA